MAKTKTLGRWISRIKLFRKNPGGKRTHLATMTVHGKSKKQAKANVGVLARNFLKNVEGFQDETGFHPIRASKDYSGARAGEKRPRSYRARATRLRSATRRGTIRKG